jgi:hypothetical protein
LKAYLSNSFGEKSSAAGYLLSSNAKRTVSRGFQCVTTGWGRSPLMIACSAFRVMASSKAVFFW